MNVPCEEGGALEMAKCSRGTPRVANRLLKRARDFAAVLGDGVIDESIAREALQRMGIDDTGLDEMDRGLLRAIIECMAAARLVWRPLPPRWERKP